MIQMHMVESILRRALEEDIGTGDITTLSTIPESATIVGKFLAKETGIICGLPVVERVFQIMDPSIRFMTTIEDGEHVEKGDVFAQVEGPAQSILTGERVALNFLQRLSGIATRTAEAVAEVEGTKAMIADTRKTTPGLRVLEKYAVKVGGGSNHRFNLSDGILIKNNHISAAGSITAAVEQARRNAPHTLRIEVEVESFPEIAEALACGVEIIMLDNMNLEDMAEAVRIISGRALVEASGNMGDRNLRDVAMTGVDIISMGALTHTVRALDISLRFQL